MPGFTYSATAHNGEIFNRYSARHLKALYAHVVVGGGDTPSYTCDYQRAVSEYNKRKAYVASRNGISALTNKPLRAVELLTLTAEAGKHK